MIKAFAEYTDDEMIGDDEEAGRSGKSLGGKMNKKLVKLDNIYYATVNGNNILVIETYQNRFHNNNTYLRFLEGSKRPDCTVSEAHIKQIAEQEEKSLQVMATSTSITTQQLRNCGFQLVRTCYEVKAGKTKLKTKADRSRTDRKDTEALTWPKQSFTKLSQESDQESFNAATLLLYEYYQNKHEEINPLSVSFAEFCSVLPKNVFVQRHENHILHAAFVEENEIAYVATKEINSFQPFITEVIGKLFRMYEEVVFEADTNDEAAQVMLGLFTLDLAESFDTWLYKYVPMLND